MSSRIKTWLIWAVGLIVVIALLVFTLGRVFFKQAEVCESVLVQPKQFPLSWRGITPGESMELDEIRRILKRTPGVSSVWINAIPRKGSNITWVWKTHQGYNSIFRTQEGIVQSMSFTANCELELQDVLESWGKPEAANAVYAGLPEYRYVAVNMFYPSKGIQFVLELSVMTPVLESSTVVKEIGIGIPVDLEEFLAENPGLDAYPWPGYCLLSEELIYK